MSSGRGIHGVSRFGLAGVVGEGGGSGEMLFGLPSISLLAELGSSMRSTWSRR